MAQTSTGDIKPGMKVEMDNEPFYVVSNEFVKPGKGQAFNRIKLKNIISGRVVEKTFKSGEKLDMADVRESAMRYLYAEMDNAIFMDDLTFEQSNISFETIGKTRQWLVEDMVYEVIFYRENPIEIIPPTFMELTIAETAPGVRGDTASGRVLKSATLETGATVQVPIFINGGEKIKVDTRTCEYVGRV